MSLILRFAKYSEFSLSLCKKITERIPTTIERVMNNSKSERKSRYDGRTKKRQWEERRSDKGAGLDPSLPKLVKTNEAEFQKALNKAKRRKFCLLMGYSGVNYYGMQRNPHTKTIEEELFQALFDSAFINKECYEQVQNMQFQRAARTDKGVSAARQVVSLKLDENFDLNTINEKLPETIKVFAYKRVTKGFNAKSQCDGRTYIYLTPTVAFSSRKDPPCIQKEFKLSKEIYEQINRLLGLYVGTKNFHNFTSKKQPTDPSAKRFIRSFICEEPFVKDDVEFCVLKVNGQSFMLHQIRKMVGLVIAVLKGIASEDTITKALSVEKINIPRAPGLGLVLDYVHYERYNNKYGNDGMHEKLMWDEVEKDVQEFKEKYIYPTIINTELEKEEMVKWTLEKLSRHSYDSDEKYESDDEGADEDDLDEVETSKQQNNI